MKINEKIKILREAKNWSQEEMAIKLHLSKNGYAKIERGETHLSLSRLEQIANVLDKDITELLALGAEHAITFNNSGNHLHCSNIVVGKDDNYWVQEIAKYQQIIVFKDEIIGNKNEVIATQRREIELLNEKITQLSQKIQSLSEER